MKCRCGLPMKKSKDIDLWICPKWLKTDETIGDYAHRVMDKRKEWAHINKIKENAK